MHNFTKTEYNHSNPTARKFLKQFNGIPFVPVDQVHNVFNTIIVNKPEFSPDVNNKVNVFVEYFQNFWMSIDSELWNHFENQGPRTNNHLEGWHSRLNRKFTRKHPNLWVLLEQLKKEEALASLAVTKMNAGFMPKKKAKYAQSDEKLRTMRLNYLRGSISAVQLAHGAAFLY